MLKHLDIVPEKVERIFIILHGYSSNKEATLKIFASLLDVLPNTAFISAESPYDCEIGQGFQWFSIEGDLEATRNEARRSSAILDDFIDEQLKKYNLNDSQLMIGGFSQGSVMALYNGLRRKHEPLCLVLFSCLLLDSNTSLKQELSCRPKTFLANGDSDAYIPKDFYVKTKEILEQNGVPLESHLIENKDHYINQDCIKLCRKFIRKILHKPDFYPLDANQEEINQKCYSNIVNFMNKMNLEEDGK